MCAIAACFPDGRVLTTRGTMEGQIGYEEKGENGFGYDPIFYLPEYQCYSGELPLEEKNKLSHRGKALRLMKQAETFGRPIICFVDTPGAFCGLEAEERGQGEAIAKNLFEMSSLKVPVLSIVIGEGGSGGALAMAVANEVWMMENAIYSILSPEGFASILYKDSKKAPEAARVMKVTAADLKELGLIERIIPEEEPANTDPLYRIAGYMDRSIIGFFEKYLKLSGEELAEHRYERFRRM